MQIQPLFPWGDGPKKIIKSRYFELLSFHSQELRMGIRTGKQYLKAIDQAPREIWIDGEKITSNYSQHPVFYSIARSIARLYDIQGDPKLIEEMTYLSPLSGDRVGMSFLPPKTMEDLLKRRKMMNYWTNDTFGMLSRPPDFLNSCLMAMASAADIFGVKEPRYAQNIKRYYEYIRENDLLLTFSMTNPAIDKSYESRMQPNPHLITSIVEKNQAGVVIRGSRMIVTLLLADEIIVFPSTHLKVTQEDAPYTFAFAIPLSTPGIKMICRESFAMTSHYDHPLASRFDEQDAIVVFDDVLVPWDRVFLLEDIHVANTFREASGCLAQMCYQATNKDIAKIEFILGVIFRIAEISGVTIFPHVQESISKAIITLETMKAFIRASEADAKVNQWGIMTPDYKPLYTARILYPKLYPKLREIIQQLSASSLVSLPGEMTMNSAIRKDIDIYCQGKNATADERIRLFHLAWDIAGSGFSSRQELYERFAFGDPMRKASEFYNTYNKEICIDKVNEFLFRNNL